MTRGERLIKLGDIWYSTKVIEVKREEILLRGKALDDLRQLKSTKL